MFDALRVIGQGGETPPRDQHSIVAAQSSISPKSREGTEEWLSSELRHLQRRCKAVRAQLEQPAEDASNGKAQQKGVNDEKARATVEDSPATAALHVPRHVSARLCAGYEKPLVALHVTSAAAAAPPRPPCSPSCATPSVQQDVAALSVLSDSLPTAMLWGMATQVWHSAEYASCPALRHLAAAVQQENPSCLSAYALAAQQAMPQVLRMGIAGEVGRVMNAVSHATATLRARKRSRDRNIEASLNADEGGHVETQATAMPAQQERAMKSVTATSADIPSPLAATPLRSTAARAQAAASSRSRSRTPPPPPRSRSRSPPPKTATPFESTTPDLSNASSLSAAAVAGRRSRTGHSSSTSFSFGVRVAGPGGSYGKVTSEGDGGADGVSRGNRNGSLLKSQHVSPGTITAATAAASTTNESAPTSVYRIDDSSPHATAQSLRQTTLASFASHHPTRGDLAAPSSPPPPPPQQQQLSVNAVTPVEAAQMPNHTSCNRQSRYNPPSLPGSSKAPPYQYDWRGSASGVESTEESLSSSRAVVPPQPPSSVGALNYTTSSSNSGGGFVTAGEQLVADIKQGRAMSSAYLSKRSPALGLRRSGFQPPFRDQQQQQQPDGQENACGGRASKPQSNARAHATSDARQNNNNNVNVNNDEEGGTYPASLLLPDGSVPPILLPLDPKLVTQVAMEILDSGAGAKQVGWDDIAGLQHAKASVEEAIVWPLRRPDIFVGLRDPPRGLLLFGPPGTGKTMIARAIANRAGCTFLNISSSSLMSKWMGDGEKLVRCLFAVATVRQPSVIFIDEIDSLLSMRGEGEMDSVRRVKTEFLVQLDGVATDRGDRVLLIGATNRPDELDEAARRRMEKRLYIPLPDEVARRELIQRLLRSLGPSSTDERETRRTDSCKEEIGAAAAVHTLTEEDLDSLVRHTHGYSGADLKQLCREAAMGPLREMSAGQLSAVAVTDLRPIQWRDFKQALKRLKPSVGPAEVERYVEWNRLFGSFNDQDSENYEDDLNSNDDAEN